MAVILKTDNSLNRYPIFQAIWLSTILFNTQVVRFLDATEDAWEISRNEIEVGVKLGEGNYGAVFRGELTVTAMSPAINAHKQRMDFEGKSHLSVAVKMLQRKCVRITHLHGY